jgi:hypothetical protein
LDVDTSILLKARLIVSIALVTKREDGGVGVGIPLAHPTPFCVRKLKQVKNNTV